jgi:malate dehydrogenase
MKISIIGAGGEVGKNTLAAMFRIFPKDVEMEIILINRNEGKARAAYGDVAFESDGLFLSKYKNIKTKIKCQVSSDPRDLSDSDVVVFTAGVSAAQIGSTNRESALPFVYKMVSSYALHIKEYAPRSLILMITNPVDISTWIMQEKTEFPPERVLGFGCELDSRRFIRFFRDELRDIGLTPDEITADVVGGHSVNAMIFPRASIKLDGKNLSEFLSELDELKQIEVEQALENSKTKARDYGFKMIRDGGKAYAEPAVFLAYAARSYLFGSEIIMSCSQVLKTERACFGIEDSCISVPVKIDKRTVEIDKERYLLSKQELELISSVAHNHQNLFANIKSMPNELIEKFESALVDLNERRNRLQTQIQNIERSSKLDDELIKLFIGVLIEVKDGFGDNKHSELSIKIKDSIDITDEKRSKVLHSIADFCEKSLDVKVEFDEEKKCFSLSKTSEVVKFLKSCNQQYQSRL